MSFSHGRCPGTFVAVSASASTPWAEFSADPRDPATASLRASDRDRDVVLRVLAEAYADGRLTREEYDERADVAGRARTLGELPPLVTDLVPQAPAAPGNDLVLATPEELQRRAVEAYRASRRRAVSGLASTTLVLTAIWFVLSGGNGFYWPVFVLVFGSANLLRVLLNRRDLVEEERRRLEKKQRKSLEPPPSV
jgi:hypothetical protein